MNKIKRAAIWTLSNAGFAWALWAGYTQGVAGAHHIAVFYIWLSFVGSLFVFSKDVREKLLEKGPAVPVMLDASFDSCAIAFLVWHGAWFLGLIYLLHTVFVHGTYGAAKPATTP